MNMNIFENIQVRDGMFPILGSADMYKRVDAIPIATVKEHDRQCRINHAQTPEELARRGGLSYREMYAVLNNKRYSEVADVSDEECKKFVQAAGGEQTFIVPVEWTLCGLVAVHAKSAEDACRKLAENNDHIGVPSSRYGEYLDGSFTVPGLEDEAIDRCLNYTKEYNNGRQFCLLNHLK